jgi:hypothetical protein
MHNTHIKLALEKDGWKREVKTLSWQHGNLVDHIGCNKFSLNGEISNGNINWGSLFNCSKSFSNGEYTVLFEKYGTKGLVLKGDELIREINRSYYCAEAYEYPVVIFTSIANQICLAHCPDSYNVIEIEDLMTGIRLTTKERDSHDFFQSRLEVNSDGTLLLSAGWVWHPVDMVEIYDLKDISNPTWFNLYHDESLNLFELKSATFLDNKTVAVTGNEEDGEQNFICVYDIEKNKLLSKSKLNEIAGNMMVIDASHVLGFYEHPKLINVYNGTIEEKWTEIDSGKSNGSMNIQNNVEPPIAIDRNNNRVAIANSDFIHVLEFHKS